MDGSANVPSSRMGIPEETFSQPSSSLMAESDIMALYEQNSQNSCTDQSEDQNPCSFGMQGATININHSKDIHFGAKSIIPPLLSTGSISSIHNSLLTPCESLDSVATPSTSVDLNVVADFDKIPQYQSCDTPPESRRFSEGITTNLPPSYRVNFSSSNSSSGSIISGTSLDQKSLQKTMSTPVKPIPGKVSLQHPASQMSAAVSNSSNVQMGTQIIYNYYIKDSGNQSRSPQCSTITLDNQQPLASIIKEADNSKNFLIKFREKLTSVYQKRAISSPLPWYRGKQLIKINEYYTEPQFFAVDKFGNKTKEIVNLMSVLQSDTETRFLVEGEAGMGKTFLATKLAEEWAKGLHLQQFQILFLITLADFKGSLQEYLKELLPSYYELEKFDRIWEYCKSHDKEILFILDGYDELQRYDKSEIQNLIKSKDFPESKVLVTCRPNQLEIWEKKIVVSGFGQVQIMEFIEKYFRAIDKSSCGESLRRIVEKDEKYWKLAKRPLFCVILCMLYITGDSGESLPERQSEVMLQMILCLIKWNRKDNSNASIDFDSLPLEYEKPFYQFGKLCMEALSTENSRFSDQDVKKVEGFDTKLKQLGFLYNDNENHALGPKEFWKPVHQTFLEYLAAFYMSKHIRECKGCKECKNFDIIFLKSSEVLQFCVGILCAKAHKLFDSVRYKFLRKQPINTILHLLKEAGPPQFDNCRAVARLLDASVVEISTSEIEFEGWSYILPHSFRRLTTLRIAWRIKSRSPDQESSFTEASQAQYAAFFDALKANESIRCIQVRAKQDGEPFSDEKISFFFSHLQRALYKKNLQELEIIEMRMTASGHLRSALETVAFQPNKEGDF